MGLVLIGTEVELQHEMNMMENHLILTIGQTGYEIWSEVLETEEGVKYIPTPTLDPRFQDYIPGLEEIDLEGAFR